MYSKYNNCNYCSMHNSKSYLNVQVTYSFFSQEKITNEKLCANIGFQIKYIFEKLMNYNTDGFSEQFNGFKMSETCQVE